MNKELFPINHFIKQDHASNAKQNKKPPSFVLNLENKTKNFSKSTSTIFENINKKLLFDNYIVSHSNASAYKAISAICEHIISKNYCLINTSCLYIHSAPGLGKTHLLNAIANKLISKNMCNFYLLDANNFAKEISETFREKKNIYDVNKKYTKDINLLIIDNINEISKKSRTQQELLNIIESINSKGGCVIFSSNASPEYLDNFCSSIKSKFINGSVIKINNCDKEFCYKFLEEKSKKHDLFIPNDVLKYIINLNISKITELKYYFNILLQHKNIYNMEIDIGTVKDFVVNKNHYQLNIRDIADIVCKYFNINIEDLISKSRKKHLANARHITTYLARNKLNMTMKEISCFIGKRDHSFVAHSVKKIDSLMKINNSLKQDIKNISSKLSEL